MNRLATRVSLCRMLLALLATCGTSVAEVWMPAIFGDNMVLQQGRNIPIWGKGAPGERVKISVGGKTAEAIADVHGRWKTTVGPLASGSASLEMRVKGNNELVFRNVLVGDVWVCAGQSNMAWPLSMTGNGEERAKQADFPQIRFFRVKRQPSFELEEDPRGSWVICTPAEASGFSATAYYFGKEIHALRKTPVGLICSAVGGTPAELWTSTEKMSKIPALRHYSDDFFEIKARLPELTEKFEKEDLPRWREEEAKWKASPEPRGKRPRQPIPPQAPSVLFNGMIHPLIPYAITGVIWYQGEANSSRATEYAELFPAMIEDWRARWEQGDFPFLYVQLAGYHNPDWVDTREAQKKALALPATAMAVAIDVGEEKKIHPKDKETVGHRLAQAARNVAYGEDVEYSGPVFAGAAPSGHKLVVTFNHTGSGLMAAGPTGETATELQGFEVAGNDGRFVPAMAQINKNTVILSSDKVPQPVHVRYAWAAWPVPMANLYNNEGLPGVPFNSRPEPTVETPHENKKTDGKF